MRQNSLRVEESFRVVAAADTASIVLSFEFSDCDFRQAVGLTVSFGQRFR